MYSNQFDDLGMYFSEEKKKDYPKIVFISFIYFCLITYH